MYSCNVCKDEGKEPFRVPGDPIGVELMKGHLAEAHGITDFQGGSRNRGTDVR